MFVSMLIPPHLGWKKEKRPKSRPGVSIQVVESKRNYLWPTYTFDKRMWAQPWTLGRCGSKFSAVFSA